RRHRTREKQQTSLPGWGRLSVAVEHFELNAGQRQRGGSRFGRSRSRQRRDENGARLGLPPRIHHWAAAAQWWIRGGRPRRAPFSSRLCRERLLPNRDPPRCLCPALSSKCSTATESRPHPGREVCCFSRVLCRR